jgi:hypothetical protein
LDIYTDEGLASVEPANEPIVSIDTCVDMMGSTCGVVQCLDSSCNQTMCVECIRGQKDALAQICGPTAPEIASSFCGLPVASPVQETGAEHTEAPWKKGGTMCARSFPRGVELG